MSTSKRELTTCADIHRVRVVLHSPYRSVIDHFEHDFGFFLSTKKKKKASLTLRLHAAAQRPTDWTPVLKTSRSVVYLTGHGERRIRFFDQAWVGYDFDRGRAEIYCDDEAVAYEVAYLVTLSFVGESLDRRGIHRIHGLGVTLRGRGALVLAPSGTGKSTLAMQVLTKKSVGILSDDTPLIRRDGAMMAFPQRIGLKEMPAQVSKKHVRKFPRVQYGEKIVVGSSYFARKIALESTVDAVFIADRNRNEHSSIRPANRRELAWPLVKWLVIGYETPQVWELFVRLTPRDVWWKSWTLYSRARAAWSLFKVNQISELRLSNDPIEAGRVFYDWAKENTEPA